jgi:hypothetical protein
MPSSGRNVADSAASPIRSDTVSPMSVSLWEMKLPASLGSLGISSHAERGASSSCSIQLTNSGWPASSR